jgi:ATP-dependent Clp protease ATP-binding subunit ClpC
MYERFTDRSRKVMQLANQEAQRFQHEYIGTEHILLGLVKEGSGVAANVLKNLNIDLRKIRLEVEKIVQSGPDMVTMGKLPQTPRAKKVIEFAIEEARQLNHNYVGTEHLLLGLLRETEGVGALVLMDLGLKLDDVRAEVLNLLGSVSDPSETREQSLQLLKAKTPTLDSYGVDLTELARQGKLYPLIGRHNEIERLLLVLSCHTDRSAVLVGPRGVGKSALIHGLAHLLAKASPPQLPNGRLIQISLAKMVLDTKDDSAKLMKRIHAVADDAHRGGNVLLFIRDLFSFGHDSRLVKAALDRGQAQWITTTSPDTYASWVKDDLLGRNWQPVFVNPPSVDEAVAILRALRPSYRDREQLEIGDDALTAAVELSERHFPDECLPGKAIRVLEQSIALLRLKQPPPPPEAHDIEERLKQLQEGKEAAVAATDFERAARLRNDADILKKQRIELLKEWQAAIANRVLDAQLVEQVVSKLTGVQFRGSDGIRTKPPGM